MILDKVTEIVSEVLKYPEEIFPHHSLKDDLGADSLDMVDIVTSVEEAFRIDIWDEEYLEIKTVGDIVELIEKKVG